MFCSLSCFVIIKLLFLREQVNHQPSNTRNKKPIYNKVCERKSNLEITNIINIVKILEHDSIAIEEIQGFTLMGYTWNHRNQREKKKLKTLLQSSYLISSYDIFERLKYWLTISFTLFSIIQSNKLRNNWNILQFWRIFQLFHSLLLCIIIHANLFHKHLNSKLIILSTYRRCSQISRQRLRFSCWRL